MPPMVKVPPSLDLHVAGAVSRSQLRNLSVIQGVQSVVPIELYDTLTVPTSAAPVTYTFFQNTRGANGIWTTNLESPNQLISGKVQIVTEIQLDVTQIAPASTYQADLMQIAHGAGSFTLFINNVEYAQGLIKDLIGGGYFGYGSLPQISSANVPYATPRAGSGCGFLLSPALVIPTQTQFNVTLTFPSTAAPSVTVATLIRIKLLGQQVRLMSA